MYGLWVTARFSVRVRVRSELGIVLGLGVRA